MSRAWRVAAVIGTSTITLMLGFPYSCWTPDCIPDADYCGEGSTNVLGMDFRGCWPLLPIAATIAIGVAAGLIVAIVERLRRSGE